MEKQSSDADEYGPWDDTSSTLAPSILSTTPTLNSNYPEPSYTSSNPPPPSTFHTLLATNSHLVNIILSPLSTPDHPLFHATNSQWSPSKPSVTLSLNSKTGPTLGVLKLGWGSENVYGLGDPTSEKDGGEAVKWEPLRRSSKWTHGTYEFFFEGRGFVWHRTRMPIFADQPDLELREGVEGGSAGAGEVLAVYIGCQGWGRKRGRFYLRKGGIGGEGRERKEAEKWWDDWDIAVLLTGLGIIEGSRRRARQRRGGGGG